MSNQNQPLVPLPAEAALHKLRAGEALRGYHVIGQLNLLSLSPDDICFPYPLVIENCRVDDLRGGVVQYEQKVELCGTRFSQADFLFAYFPGGLHIEACEFESYLDFHAGGHNQAGNSFTLRNNRFGGFVNFFDCLYEDAVQVEGNEFQQGTNLLGAPEGYPVEFSVAPSVQRNTGDLHRNDEGERPTGSLLGL